MLRHNHLLRVTVIRCRPCLNRNRSRRSFLVGPPVGCGMVGALSLRACAIFVFHAFRRLFIQATGASLAGRRCSVMALTITVGFVISLTQGKGSPVQLDDFARLTALAVSVPTAFNHLAGQRAGFTLSGPQPFISLASTEGLFFHGVSFTSAGSDGSRSRRMARIVLFHAGPESGFVTPDSSE